MLPTLESWNADCEAPDNPNCNTVDDWRYEMRREMQEIVPGLFLGPFAACRNDKQLKATGITHILCFLDENEIRIFKTDHLVQNFIFNPVQISDSTVQNLIPVFPQCTQFIKETIDQNGKVLACCNTGMSRSPSFVIAYTMEVYNMNATQAYQYVQSKRLCINPNDGFKSQLSEYEPIYMARKTNQSQNTVPQDQQRRRRRSGMDEEDDIMTQDMDPKRRPQVMEDDHIYGPGVAGMSLPQ